MNTSSTEVSDIVGALSEVRGRLWESWLVGARAVPVQPWNELYQQSWELYEDMFNGMHQLQLELNRVFLRGLAQGWGPSEPEATADWVSMMESIMQGWSDVQQQTWNTSLTAVRELSPLGHGGQWSDHAQTVLQRWQDAYEKALTLQGELMSTWLRRATEEEAEVRPEEPSVAVPQSTPVDETVAQTHKPQRQTKDAA